LVRHFSAIAISSHCFFVVRHFHVLQIQRPLQSDKNEPKEMNCNMSMQYMYTL